VNQRTLRVIGIAMGFLLLLAAYGAIGIAIRAERQRQADIEQQIAPLQTALALRREGANVLPTRQAELATLEAQRVQAQFAFPSEIDSTEVLAHIVATAAAQGVNLRRLEARDPITVTIGASTYRGLAYDVQVDGELASISAFLTALEAGPVGTLVLDQIRLEARPTPTSSPPSSEAASPLPPYRATLVVRVYMRLAGPETTPLPSAATLSPEERARQLETSVETARQEEDWARAISLLLALRSLRPDDPELAAQLVEAYVRDGQRRRAAGQVQLAEADFQAALEIDPENVEAKEGLEQLTALLPTATPTVTPTPGPTATPTPSPTPMPYYVLHLEFRSNDRYPDLGCNWFGFVGKVTDASGYPVSGVTVKIWAAGWAGVQTTTLSSGEYEQFLDDHPRAERWMIQLYEGGVAVSPVVTVESRADCSAALIRMDWQRGY